MRKEITFECLLQKLLYITISFAYNPAGVCIQQEDGMPVLKSLQFTTLPQPGTNPTLDRRNRIIERLEEQKRLVADSNYHRTVRSWVVKDGQKITVEKQQRVLPWWRIGANGQYVFFVRAGQKPIEFEKGKAATINFRCFGAPQRERLPAQF